MVSILQAVFLGGSDLGLVEGWFVHVCCLRIDACLTDTYSVEVSCVQSEVRSSDSDNAKSFYQRRNGVAFG